MLRLVIEEIGINIVKFVYQKDVSNVIQLQYTNGDSLLRVIIRDHGRPFDPGAPPDSNMNADIATRPIGGLGLFLVRASTDELQYHHDLASGWNEMWAQPTAGSSGRRVGWKAQPCRSVSFRARFMRSATPRWRPASS
jgi:hypothetical protein